MLFNSQLSTSGTGVGVKRAKSAALGPRFYDGLAEAVERGFIGVDSDAKYKATEDMMLLISRYLGNNLHPLDVYQNYRTWLRAFFLMCV
jgi:hypothetical protein